MKRAVTIRLLDSLRLVLLLLFSQWTVAVAGDGENIVIGQRLSISSQVLTENRTYSVYLPPSYSNHGGYTRYPVLYLLDGESFFDSFVTTVRYMGSGINGNTRFPEMIVVAIHNTDRNRDMTPTRSMKGPFGYEQPAYTTTGGLPNFLRFIRSELIPHIDATYRTTRYRLFVGHSLAGLAVVETLLTAPDLFDAYVALDPSLWWDGSLPLRAAQQSARSLNLTRKQVFIATAEQLPTKLYGTVDLHVPGIIKAIRVNRSQGLSVSHKHYKNEDHGSVPLIAFLDGISHVFDGHKIDLITYYDLPERIDVQYKALSHRLGTELHPTEVIINSQGYSFLMENGLKDVRKALIYFKMNARNYPDSFNAWDSLAEGTLANGDRQLAASYYRKSLALNPSNENAKRMLERLAAD